MEQAVGSVRELGLPSGCAGIRRLQYRLEEYRRIRIPALLSNTEMSDQDIDGKGGTDACDSVLASPAVVPVTARTGVRTGTNTSEGGATIGPDGPASSAGAVDPSNRLAVVRSQMESSGLSGQVVDLIMEGVRNTTPHHLGTVGTIGVFNRERIPCLHL